MEYNITYRRKDKGWQYIINIKKDNKWVYGASKQGFNIKALAKIAAEIKVNEMKANNETQANADPENKDLTFGEFKQIYFNHKRIYNEYNSMVTLESAFNHFEPLEDMLLIEIAPFHIQNCADNMTTTLLPTTISLYLAYLSTFFNTAIKQYRIIKDNPVSDIKIPLDKRQKKQKALNKIDMDNLLSKSSPYRKYYIASLIASKCGLRVGEITGLTWDRVDFKEAEMTVNRQWKFIEKGKSGFAPTKSINSNRVIPVPPIVVSELIKFKKEYPIDFSNRILPYNNTNGLATALSRFYTKIGYVDVSIHDLRHTYGTMLIAGGLDFKTVAELMGHDVQETIKTYSHVTSDMRLKATNTINSIF